MSAVFKEDLIRGRTAVDRASELASALIGPQLPVASKRFRILRKSTERIEDSAKWGLPIRQPLRAPASTAALTHGRVWAASHTRVSIGAFNPGESAVIGKLPGSDSAHPTRESRHQGKRSRRWYG